MLAYQFVAGLVGELKTQLVGREGTFEQLLEVAHFEEARIQDMVQQENTTQHNLAPFNGKTDNKASHFCTAPYTEATEVGTNLLSLWGHRTLRLVMPTAGARSTKRGTWQAP